MVKPTIERLILALAMSYSWSLKQFDVSNAFLHGIFKEEVYMAQPFGNEDLAALNHVCLLHWAIYGVK